MKHTPTTDKLTEKIDKHKQLIKQYESLGESEHSPEISYHRRMIAYLKTRRNIILRGD